MNNIGYRDYSDMLRQAVKSKLCCPNCYSTAPRIGDHCLSCDESNEEENNQDEEREETIK